MTLKKFQELALNKQLLTSLLLKFKEFRDKSVSDKEEIIDKMNKHFSELFSFGTLSDKDKENWIEKLKIEYNDYVIKPLKEGGNNNFNYEQVKQLAEERNLSILNESLVMKRIRPIPTKNYILKGMEIIEENVITEIGFFTYVITDINKEDNDIIEIKNVESSPFFRTKAEKQGEGGMSIGASYANSGYLVDDYFNLEI